MAARQAVAKLHLDDRWLAYMQALTETKIVFTATPDLWDGDYRTWEALWSGACVFVDRNYIPVAEMPRGGAECFYYDAADDRSIARAIQHARALLNSDSGVSESARWMRRSPKHVAASPGAASSRRNLQRVRASPLTARAPRGPAGSRWPRRDTRGDCTR